MRHAASGALRLAAAEVLLLVAVLLLAAVTAASETLPSPILSAPSLAGTRACWPTREWRTARPTPAGMDESVLGELSHELSAYGVRAALIVRRGLLVDEL